MDAQAQAESHYIIIPLGEVDEFWGSWHALVDESRCQPKIRPTSTPNGSSSLTNAKLLRENFPAAPSIPHQEGKSTRKQEQCLRCQEDCPPHQETPPSVAALQCYSSKTSNAKLKKKFILYIFIYINIYKYI